MFPMKNLARKGLKNRSAQGSPGLGLNVRDYDDHLVSMNILRDIYEAPMTTFLDSLNEALCDLIKDGKS